MAAPAEGFMSADFSAGSDAELGAGVGIAVALRDGFGRRRLRLLQLLA